MSSSHRNSANPEAACYFAPPGACFAKAWHVVMEFLKEVGLAQERYPWYAHGSKPHENRNLWEESSGEDIIRALESEVVSAWSVHMHKGAGTVAISLGGPYSRSPWQLFRIFSQIPESPLENLGLLIEDLASLAKLALAMIDDQDYASWQRCTNPKYYAEHYGSTQGFRVIHVPANPPFPAEARLDTSANPGRGQQVNGGPATVAADMWLGPAFWTYAPCGKEQVLAQPWVEVRDTEHFLYIKSYPQPFTRPDGEQGQIQRRLWKLLFHSDCHWPPLQDPAVDFVPRE